MAIGVIVGRVALACASACGILSTIAHFEMVDKVNDKLASGKWFEQLGWYLSKSQRLHREYRRLYPAGRFLFKIRVLIALAIACFLASAWALGTSQ